MITMNDLMRSRPASLHVVFLSGITQAVAMEITKALNSHSVPYGHEVKVIGLPNGEPRLLGTVVINDDAVSMRGVEPEPWGNGRSLQIVTEGEDGE